MRVELDRRGEVLDRLGIIAGAAIGAATQIVGVGVLRVGGDDVVERGDVLGRRGAGGLLGRAQHLAGLAAGERQRTGQGEERESRAGTPKGAGRRGRKIAPPIRAIARALPACPIIRCSSSSRSSANQCRDRFFRLNPPGTRQTRQERDGCKSKSRFAPNSAATDATRPQFDARADDEACAAQRLDCCKYTNEFRYRVGSARAATTKAGAAMRHRPVLSKRVRERAGGSALDGRGLGRNQPSRWARLRASLRARRTASAFSRAFFSEGFS